MFGGSESVYITGYTGSTDFPTTPGAFDTTYNSGGDVFGLKISMTSYVRSIIRASASPTALASVDFIVTLSESVTGMDTIAPFNDFALTTSPGISGAFVTGVSGIGAIYTVTVNTGNGNGTLRLDIPDTATITDTSGDFLSGLPFITGEVYTVDKSIPLPSPWIGGISVTSDKNIVAVGRPHIGSEIASYDGFSAGALTAYVPMLFKNAFEWCLRLRFIYPKCGFRHCRYQHQILR